MKKLPILTLISVLLIILQQAILSQLKIFNVYCDLVYVYIVCFSIVRPESESVIIALITGILRDAFFPQVFGINTVTYLITAYVIGLLQKKLFKESIIIPMLFTFIATYIEGILFCFLYYLVSIKFDFTLYAANIIPKECVINSVISILMYKFILKLNSNEILKQEWNFKR